MKIKMLPKNIAVLAIIFYQKQLSNYKYFRCAYASLHEDISCSEYGKKIIEEKGLLKGLLMLRFRFKKCRQAALQIQTMAYLLVLSGCQDIGASVEASDQCGNNQCCTDIGEGCGEGCAKGCMG